MPAVALLDLLLPTDCAGCGRPRQGAGPSSFCQECWSGLPRFLWPVDPVPQGLATAWAYVDYGDPAGAAWRRAKYRPDPATARLLAARLALASAGRLPEIDRVVAVPQSPWTTLRRGFSPVGLLADELGRVLERPVARALVRRRAPPQAGLGPQQRLDNARAAFRAREGDESVRGQRVLLLDDVLTTGATLTASAWELLGAGATRVHGLALCRAA